MNHHDKANTEVEHQFQQSAANKLQNNVSGSDKREDSDRCYVETLRAQQGERHSQEMRFRQDKHDQEMREAKQHAERMDQLRLSPSEAKSQSEVLSGVQLEAIKAIVVEVLKGK